MGIDEGLIARIVERVLSASQPECIILFGSAATGSMGPDSDIDILVLHRGVGDAREESVRIRSRLRGLGFPFDVVMMRIERFQETRDVIGGLAYPAARQGKVIYGAT